MSAKKLITTGVLALGATLALATAASAQDYGYYGGGPYYDQWGGPGYGYGYNYGPALPDVDRGGPGPRVGAGSGMGIGAQR
jgi:hypothetical protein